MSGRIVKTGGHLKNNANEERKIHCRQNVALKSFEQQTISQPSPQLTDESEFPSLNKLSNKVYASSQASGGAFKYSDKLKLHSNQNTAPNYFRFQQEPIRKDLSQKHNQFLSSPQLKNKWFQDTGRDKLNEKSDTRKSDKQNEPSKPDFVNRKVLNSTLVDRRSQTNQSPSRNDPRDQRSQWNKSLKEYPSTKTEFKNQRQKPDVNKLDSKLHSSFKPTVDSSDSSAKSSSQMQSRKEIKLILGKNLTSNDSSEVSKKKKKRKSKVKRQVGLQTGKITVLTPEVHSKILNQTSVLSTQNFKTILTDINDENEYPELGKSQKENYTKKEATSLESGSEEIKITDQNVEIAVQDQHLVTKDGTKDSDLLSSTPSDDKSAEKKGKESKPVHPNDPITVSFFDILVNKNCKQVKVKDHKTEVDPPLSIGLIKAKTQKNSVHPHNLLDSSSPAVKRGKEREKPKPKKPSQLKKIILMDRKARKEQLLLLKNSHVEQEISAFGDVNESKNNEIPCEVLLSVMGDQDLQEILSESPEENCNVVPDDDCLQNNDSECSPILCTDFNACPNSAVCHSDICKSTEGENFPKEISDDSASVDASQKPSDMLDNTDPDVTQTDPADKEKAVKVLLHTRNFREYCNHLISKDIDDVVYALLDDLARFQDRMHQKDPVKARMKRRMIYGVKEVKKHVKLKKLRCIIVAADIENIETHGGLNDLLNDIKSSAADHRIPCVFALSRKALGKVCRKPVPVSCVGVFNYEGSELNFKTMIELQTQSKIDYTEISAKLSECITNEQITSLLKAKREAPETLRLIRTTILGDFFLENKANQTNEDMSNKGEGFCI